MSDWAQRVNQGTMVQEVVNRNVASYRATDLSAIAERQALNQGYEQYRGYFDWWFKVQIKKDVRTKLGLAFKARDVTIGSFEKLEGERRLVVMSFRNGYVSTFVRLEDAEAF